MTQIKYGLVLTTGPCPRKSKSWREGALLAICSDGSPQLGHKDVQVLDLEVVDSQEEARKWFELVKITQPWLTRQ